MIRYKSGYNYQLVGDYFHRLSFSIGKSIYTHYINVASDGKLLIKMGYAWDGPSGPAIDTRNFMRGSLVHDALYQLIRDQHLEHDIFRARADMELRKICLEDGMSKLRAWWVYQGVRYFGGPASRTHKKLNTAP